MNWLLEPPAGGGYQVQVERLINDSYTNVWNSDSIGYTQALVSDIDLDNQSEIVATQGGLCGTVKNGEHVNIFQYKDGGFDKSSCWDSTEDSLERPSLAIGNISGSQ
jgi:hypothetical protein